MTTDQLQGHIEYVLSMQTHKLHEARKACKVYTRRYRAVPTDEQVSAWQRQMGEFDLADGNRNLSRAVADLYRIEDETQRWANQNMRPLMDWTRSPEGQHRVCDN